MMLTYKKIFELAISFNESEKKILKKIIVDKNHKSSLMCFILEYRYKFDQTYLLLKLIVNEFFFSKKDLRLFAIWCAKMVTHLVNDRSLLSGLNLVEKYALGLVGREVLIDIWQKGCGNNNKLQNNAADVIRRPAYPGSDLSSEAYTTAVNASIALKESFIINNIDSSTYNQVIQKANMIQEEVFQKQINCLLNMINKPEAEWFFNIADKKYFK